MKKEKKRRGKGRKKSFPHSSSLCSNLALKSLSLCKWVLEAGTGDFLGGRTHFGYGRELKEPGQFESWKISDTNRGRLGRKKGRQGKFEA